MYRSRTHESTLRGQENTHRLCKLLMCSLQPSHTAIHSTPHIKTCLRTHCTCTHLCIHLFCEPHYTCVPASLDQTAHSDVCLSNAALSTARRTRGTTVDVDMVLKTACPTPTTLKKCCLNIKRWCEYTIKKEQFNYIHISHNNKLSKSVFNKIRALQNCLYAIFLKLSKSVFYVIFLELSKTDFKRHTSLSFTLCTASN